CRGAARWRRFRRFLQPDRRPGGTGPGQRTGRRGLMLPLVFLPDTPTLLAGRGPALAKRHAVLAAAGFTVLTVHEGMPLPAMLDGMRLVFGAGLTPDESAALAATARERGIAVNIE